MHKAKRFNNVIWVRSWLHDCSPCVFHPWILQAKTLEVPKLLQGFSYPDQTHLPGLVISLLSGLLGKPILWHRDFLYFKFSVEWYKKFLQSLCEQHSFKIVTDIKSISDKWDLVPKYIKNLHNSNKRQIIQPTNGKKEL